ncbi:MAG: hypothetical protein U0228_32950 [Myxococcaceae bacterium]
MRLSVTISEAPQVEAPPRPWVPFVTGALVFTLLFGALSGAFDLWRLRVALSPVPVDHHRGHALGQLFGFVWLFTMGLSLHLGPRFFNAPLPGAGRLRVLKWLSLGGVVLALAGRFGALLPGSAVFGPVGAVLVLAAATNWLELVLTWNREPGPRDGMHRFVVAGTAWWWVAALSFVVWQLGQAAGGPLASVPMEAVWAPALFGGASWVWGVFLRAGLCTLQLARPTPKWQRAWFVTWQVAVGAATVGAWVGPTLDPLVHLAFVVAVVVLALALRPHRADGSSPQARAVRWGLWCVGAFGVMHLWALLPLPQPALLGDATRHAFSLGAMTSFLFGFGGRMVPGFSGVRLARPRAYEVGLLGVQAAVVLRLCELSTSKLALSLSAASGGLAVLGVGLVAFALLTTVRRVPALA